MTSVFISYAHRDERLKDRFLAHLSALKRERLIDVWHDRMLKPGDHLNQKIEQELAAAEFVVLLISSDFINSDYCTEKEMRRAFARAKLGRCNVAAVILKPCMWQYIPIDDEGGRLADFTAMSPDGKPVTQWSGGQDAALHTVVTDIRRLIMDKSASSMRPVPLPMGDKVIQHYRCFISYSSRDQEFAERLHTDLQNESVRCWFAPHDMYIGGKIIDAIDEAIRLRDNVLLILSEGAIASDWVEGEVTRAFEEERRRKQVVLFPVRLDDAVMQTSEGWARLLRGQRNIGNFTGWKEARSLPEELRTALARSAR
jgi:hypothetical protein